MSWLAASVRLFLQVGPEECSTPSARGVRRMKSWQRECACGALLSASWTWASAEPIKAAEEMSPCAILIDFESLPSGAVNNPFKLQGITFWSPGEGLGIASVIGYPAHGGAVSGQTMLPRPAGQISGSPPYSDIEISLAEPASEVGLGWFDPNLPGNELRVFSANGELLESVSPMTFPPGGCCAVFVGIRRPQPEIMRIVTPG
jgi:hypothetical protein